MREVCITGAEAQFSVFTQEFSLKGGSGSIELAKGWMECARMSVIPQHHPFPLRSPWHCSLMAEKPETHMVNVLPWRAEG